jgi:RNA polymerase-associated protein LEO1
METSLTPSSSLNGAKNQGLTYLVAQHKRAEILQSEALITGYMTLRPTGMQSETHRMLVRAVGQKHNKVARLRMAPDPTTDPEREKMELLKSSAKVKTKRPKYEDDGFGVGLGGTAAVRRRRAYARKRSGDDVWSDDEDEDDAERDVFGAGSDEDEDMATGRNNSSRKPRKTKASAGDARSGGGDYQTDGFVVSDSPSDEGDAGPDSGRTSKKKRKRRNASEEMDDDLDKLDAKIEEAERMRGKPGGNGSVSDDQQPDHLEPGDMDIESEEADEEDDEHQVRKAGDAPAGRRRRLAVDLEEEE